MKTITLVLLLFSGSLVAQSVPMQRGQPFPFDEGLALSKQTQDSTKNYVQKLQRDYLAEVSKNRELEMKYSILSFDHDNQTIGFQGIKTQLEIIKPKCEKCETKKKRRFWIGLGVGIVVTTAANIAGRKL